MNRIARIISASTCLAPKRPTMVQGQAWLSSCQSSDLVIDLDENTGVQTLRINRPQRLNAINSKLYMAIPAALTASADDPKVKITVLTGTGRYFSSGNDLADFASQWTKAESPKAAAEMSAHVLRNYVAAFIEYPKVLVAALNGPAVGISATILGLFDAVYMSEKATIRTPFASVGQAPEGCSSYTFPRIMGRAKANELLLFDQVLNAQEAQKCGYVNEVFPEDSFEERVRERLAHMASFQPNVLERIKSIIRAHDTELLHAVNERECQHLARVWQSEECANAIQVILAKLGNSK